MRALLSNLAMLGTLSLVLAAGAASSAGPGAAQEPSTLAMIGLTDWQEDQLLAERESRYRYIVVRDVRPETRRALGRLVRANPGSRVLLYADAGFMVHQPRDPAACDYWPFNGDGVDYCEARKRREGWFLHRAPARPGEPARARRLRSQGYPGSWAADIGSRSYRREWIRNVRARLSDAKGNGSGVRVAGVFMDDLNLIPGHGLNGRIEEYSDQVYGELAVGFGRAAARALGRAGFGVVANVGLDVHDPVQRQNLALLAPELTAVTREQFVRYGASDPVFTSPAASNGNDWLTELELFESVQAAGGRMLALVYGRAPQVAGERDVARYARATFLLGWDGRSESALAFRTLDGYDPKEFAAWQVDLGTPLAARMQVGERQAWMRRYTVGVALVNADPVSSAMFRFEELYRDERGLCTPLVELPPASGSVLARC